MISHEARVAQALDNVGDALRNLSVTTQGVSNSLDSAANGMGVTIGALQSVADGIQTANDGLQIVANGIQAANDGLQTVANGLQATADALQVARASNDSLKASVDAASNAFTRVSVAMEDILVVMRDLRDERQNGK